ncbi:sensor domain-containing diguanylate cyclase [Vibrio marisflavi]|uniref:GGDEF domain-containing protein n=1 Tax=Vibrio marisflavi CECT 7928 TaxID=634439 RepID=A0ABM8ZZY6_9VIBR|nr:sensor domain-containing diguanylate cyclase [Vibrio marisflavi]CAH0536704.1 hypothetical protein VMF7928_00638 [Vibrio marisflavi CECT 7928]
MLQPQVPANEGKRLRNLRRLGIIESGYEERFDRVTRVVRQLYDVPIAIVSLVDENWIWFKSCFGLPVKKAPRDISICGHAILTKDPLVIEDASKDPRFLDNPLVVGDPNIRFYAGIPLVYGDDTVLGTLCIIDDKPRKFSRENVARLIEIAKEVESELSDCHDLSIDPVTQISNRRGFLSLAQKTLSYCQFGKYPYSLAHLELQLPHSVSQQENDKTIQEFSALIQSTFRESDVFARTGENEFALFLAGSSNKVAHIAVKRLESAIKTYNSSGNRAYPLSFRYGVASNPSGVKSELELLLESAKNNLK